MPAGGGGGGGGGAVPGCRGGGGGDGGAGAVCGGAVPCVAARAAPTGPAAGQGSGPTTASSLPARCLNARLFKLQGSVCVAGDGG